MTWSSVKKFISQDLSAFSLFLYLLWVFFIFCTSIMSQKRHPEDGNHRVPRSEESNCPDDKRRKIPAFKKVVMDAVTMHQLQRFLEPLIRRVVKEEVELALKKHLNNMKQSCTKETQSCESRSLKLRFLNNLSLPVFTGARIEGEELSAVQIALVDCVTGQVINAGPESLTKVELVVLEGDFDSDEADNWTVEEFKNNIVREREGKKPLLTGDAILYLKEGIGFVGDISFTDNSSWTRSRRFRLGARVLDNFVGTKIKEAKTDSFIVRDHRGELYKKHHPPSLSDEVWRLEKIGKDGAFHKRLSQEQIYTVQHFLTLLFIDPTRLRNILGPGMSTKMWEITIDHARTCVLEKKMYLYCLPNSQQKNGVVFNTVFQVMGLLSEGKYVPTDSFSETDRADAQNMIVSAYKHCEDIVQYDDEVSLTRGLSQLMNVPYSSSSPKPEGSIGSKFLAPNKVNGFDFTQSTASSPDIISSFYSLGGTSGVEDYTLPAMDTMDLRYDHALSFPSQVMNSTVCSSETITHSFSDDGHLQFLNDELPPHNFCFGSPNDLHNGLDNFWPGSAVVKAQDVKVVKALKRWKMLASVLKWFFIMVNKKRSHVEKIKKILVH